MRALLVSDDAIAVGVVVIMMEVLFLKHKAI